MHRVVQALESRLPLAALVVWINMLPEDESADLGALVSVLDDARLRRFHDPRRLAGQAVAAVLGGPGQIAWDVYLGFDRGASWVEGAPTPKWWIHQLSDPWADPGHRRAGADLEPALAALVRSLQVDYGVGGSPM